MFKHNHKIHHTTNMVLHGIVGCGLGAAITCAEGALGSAIAGRSYPHEGYNANTAAKMGAMGGALIGGILGLLNGSSSFFPKRLVSIEETRLRTILQIALFSLLVGEAMGMTGWALMDSDDRQEMNNSHAAFSFMIGSLILSLPLAALAAEAAVIFDLDTSSNREPLLPS